jgi:hypothetical protein
VVGTIRDEELEVMACIMDIALYKFKFPLVVLVQQEMANSTKGETCMSHGVDETKEVAETEWIHENIVV